MDTDKTCFYCLKAYSSRNNEHVFPDGLGGQRIMMDCVCPECNDEFSKCEGELISKSFISFIRVAEGATDVSPKKQTLMKDVRTYRMDEELNVALEVRIANGLREKLVAQIVLKDKLYIRYEVQEEFDTLVKAISTWKEDNRTITLKSNDQILAFELSREKVNKKVIMTSISEGRTGYVGLEISKGGNKEVNNSLAPRIYHDAKKRLKIRARNQQEAIELIRHLLSWDGKAAPVIDTIVEGTSEISVHHNHDGVKFNRALVKIAINCLIHCYPDSKNERDKLVIPIAFARYNNGVVPFSVLHSTSDLDKQPKTHNLFFYNNLKNTCVRISLYNGAFIIAFLFPRIQAIDTNGPGRLLIEHQNFKNTFQNEQELELMLNESI